MMLYRIVRETSKHPGWDYVNYRLQHVEFNSKDEACQACNPSFFSPTSPEELKRHILRAVEQAFSNPIIDEKIMDATPHYPSQPNAGVKPQKNQGELL